MGKVPNGGDLEKDAVFEVSMVGPKLWRMMRDVRRGHRRSNAKSERSLALRIEEEEQGIRDVAY